MFRAACDNSVTTSQPASPPTANLRISKCPRARPICTKPDRAGPLHCPTTARRPLVATHHDIPSIRTHLGGTGHAISTPRSRLSSLPPSPMVGGRAVLAAQVVTFDMSGSGAVIGVGHATDVGLMALCQPTTATTTESSSFAPDSPLPGPPAIDRTQIRTDPSTTSKPLIFTSTADARYRDAAAIHREKH